MKNFIDKVSEIQLDEATVLDPTTMAWAARTFACLCVIGTTDAVEEDSVLAETLINLLGRVPNDVLATGSIYLSEAMKREGLA